MKVLESLNNMNTVSALQMARSNPAHAGISPLSPAGKGEGAGVKKPGSFENQLLAAVSTMNDQQLQVGRVEQQLITDPDSVDVHDVVTAMAKAQMSLSLAQTVIDRLVTGWNEISTTR